MRLLVTGGSGLVGWRVVEEAAKLTDQLTYTFYNHGVNHPSADAKELDIRDKEHVFEVIEAVAPDVVIHAAAVTDVDACEQDSQHARHVNTTGTKNVVDACVSVGARLVFVSTSFVFDGSKERHGPTDDRNPVNEYGHTKAAAERYVESSEVMSAIVRTDQPYGWPTEWQNSTMVQWTLQELESTDSVPVFADWHNHPTYLPDLARILVRIARDNHYGPYHVVGPDYMSRYEWATHIADVFGYDASRIVPASASDAEVPATRPNVLLDYSRLRDLNIQMVGVVNGLRKMLNYEPSGKGNACQL